MRKEGSGGGDPQRLVRRRGWCVQEESIREWHLNVLQDHFPPLSSEELLAPLKGRRVANKRKRIHTKCEYKVLPTVILIHINTPRMPRLIRRSRGRRSRRSRHNGKRARRVRVLGRLKGSHGVWRERKLCRCRVEWGLWGS
jgi:hypothetical protein